MLYYLPLEGYKERYTMQWSAPETGWLERNWWKAKVPYVRVDLIQNAPPRNIKVGSVVDGIGRAMFTFSQITTLLKLAEEGKITDDDVIYLDDFWTPGLEALPYAFHLLGINPRIYAFLHAQSVDEFDFTHPMRSWMRPVETGFAAALDGIFVCCPTLRDLVVFGGIAPAEKVHITGHPFNSEEVYERMPPWFKSGSDQGDMRNKSGRDDTVVWSSRWDREKDPMFFLRVADRVLKESETARFEVCTSAQTLRSNDPHLVEEARIMAKKWPGRFVVLQGLSKEQYYDRLCRAKVQFNCALQDFVAITLLEASVAGAYPVYPYFRSFPETFKYQRKFMYTPDDEADAVRLVTETLKRDDLWSKDALENRNWIHRRFDYSWLRMLDVMGVKATVTLDATEHKYLVTDPFVRD